MHTEYSFEALKAVLVLLAPELLPLPSLSVTNTNSNNNNAYNINNTNTTPACVWQKQFTPSSPGGHLELG